MSDTSKTHHSSVTHTHRVDTTKSYTYCPKCGCLLFRGTFIGESGFIACAACKGDIWIDTSEVDIDQSSQDSVTHTYMSHSCNGSYMSQSYMDRIISKLIGKQSSTGMSFLRFVTICAVVSICLPFIVIIMAVMVVAYSIGYLLYGVFVYPTLCLYAWWDYKQLELAVMEDDKDMVTKDKSHIQECQYCDSPDHVTSECSHKSSGFFYHQE